jgi:N-acylneuraminate cytidylyltransferase
MVNSSGPVLAIIPARGGSKGLPGKNIRLLGRHPLIAYSVASCLASHTIDRVIVSTDNQQIADVACAYGAEAPFLRPAELATDMAPDLPLFTHALQWLEREEGYEPSIVVQVRPTTPFRPHGLLDQSVKLLQSDPRADCVRAVTRPSQTPFKMWTCDDEEYLHPLLQSEHAEPYNMPRQLLPQAFWQTGHVDVIRRETILDKNSLTGERIKSVMVDSAFVVDIDRLEDLQHAEYMLSKDNLDLDLPNAPRGRIAAVSIPELVRLTVLDFDGTLTDDRVWVDQDGRESVVCSRRDGMGLEMLAAAGMEIIVISKERNPVVSRRCEKLGIPCWQGIDDKLTLLKSVLAERKMDAKETVYVGNDVGDLACMRHVGFSFAPADAHPDVLKEAGFVVSYAGGSGAVREVCEILLDNMKS